MGGAERADWQGNAVMKPMTALWPSRSGREAEKADDYVANLKQVLDPVSDGSLVLDETEGEAGPKEGQSPGMGWRNDQIRQPGGGLKMAEGQAGDFCEGAARAGNLLPLTAGPPAAGEAEARADPRWQGPISGRIERVGSGRTSAEGGPPESSAPRRAATPGRSIRTTARQGLLEGG